MANLTSSLLVKLVDGVSGTARQVAQSLGGIGQAARRLNGTNVGGFASRLADSAKAAETRVSALRGSMLEAAAAGYALARAIGSPLAVARDFESTLLDIGQKADLGSDGLARLRGRIGDLSRDLQQTISQGSLAKGVDFLAGMGLDPDRALTMLAPIGRAATAYKANVEDLAKAGYAAFDNLHVPAEQFARALDVMAQAGKEGAFEIRDMAAQFPALTAAAAALKLQGVDGVAKLSAALQIARKGAADGSTAATNTANLMQKIASPETVKKFRKQGIDIRRELARTQAAGGDVFEMIAGLVQKATKGDLSKLGDLFEDAQVQNFLRPLLANLEEYRRIRDKAAGAKGIVDADFARRLETGEAALNRFKVRLEQLALSIGTILLPAVNSLLSTLGGWIDMVAGLAERHPELTKGIVTAASALVAFRVAAIGTAWVGAFMRASFLQAAGGALAFSRSLVGLAVAPFAAAGTRLVGVLQTIALRYRLAAASGMLFSRSLVTGTLATFGRALLALLNPMALVRGALFALRLAVIGTGIGAVLVAIAAAGTWIYNNWSNLGVAFEAFKGAFDRAIAPVRPALEPVISGFQALYEWASNLLGPMDGDVFARWGIAAGKAVGEVVVWFVELPGRITAALASLGSELYGIGAGAMQGLWDGMKSLVEQMIAWVASIPSRVVGQLSSLPGKVKGMFGFGGDSAPAGAPAPGAAPVAGARAGGGGVDAGRTYLVGEKGPELFRPNRSGRITPNSQLAGASGGGGVSLSATFHINGATDPRSVADEVHRALRELGRRARQSAFADLGLRTA